MNRTSLAGEFSTEFIGTFILVFAGNCAVAAAVTTGPERQNPSGSIPNNAATESAIGGTASW